jgi:hypothetical protein
MYIHLAWWHGCSDAWRANPRAVLQVRLVVESGPSDVCFLPTPSGGQASIRRARERADDA